MKKIFIVLFICIPAISYSQFKIPNDTNFKCSHLNKFKYPDIKPSIEKSLSFELRLWTSTYAVDSAYLLRLTCNQKDIWKAEKYLINYYNNKIIKTEIQLPSNWNEIWDTLLVNNVLTLPDNPPHKNNRIIEDDEIPNVETAITDGTSYTVELLSKENNRKYSIDNPIGYFKFYSDSKPLKDFNKILEILSQIFNCKFK